MSDEREEARRILEERRKQDPLRWFVPTPSQELLLRRNTVDFPFVLVDALNRGGKSAITMADAAMVLRGIHPHIPAHKKITIGIFAPTRQQVAEVIGKKLFRDSELIMPKSAPPEATGKPMIPPWEIAELKQPLVDGMRVPKRLLMKNGNRAIFSWTGSISQDKRIAGLKLDAAYVDEEAGSPRLFAEILTRLTDALSDKSRPGLGYFVWAYTNTQYNEAYDAFKARVSENKPGHKVVTLLPGENPAVSAEAREMIGGAMDDDQAAIRMKGGISAGELVQIFRNQWSDKRHMMDREYEIQPDDNLLVGYDPGVIHPMGMVVAAINKEFPTRLNVVQCWLQTGGTLAEDAQRLADFLQGRRLAGFVYDVTLGNRDRGGGPTPLQRMHELLAERGVDPIQWWKSKKKHEAGIALLRQYMDPNTERSDAPTLLKLSKPTDANGTGMLRSQIIGYHGKEATRFAGPGGVVKKNDDLLDPLRYMCMIRPFWNKEYACGLPLISTTRVALLDKSDTIPTMQHAEPVPEAQRYNPREGHVFSRVRRRDRHAVWQLADEF